MVNEAQTPGSGDGSAADADELLPLLYAELRRRADKLNQEKPGHTMDATALVHEAYLRLRSGRANQQWVSRAQFFAAAAEAMRRLLIERARQKMSLKGGARVSGCIYSPSSAVTKIQKP